MKKILGIVVTYNRKELLAECLHALAAQTERGFDLLVIDNCSTDGTDELLKNPPLPLRFHRAKRNLGGAGGFAHGLRFAANTGYDYAWLMDDDTLPSPTALASLLNKAQLLQDDFSFLASMVRWTDGSPCVMNMMPVSKQWYAHTEAVANDLLPVVSCSFVSVLIPLHHVNTVGLPIAEFFIYGDDREYTERLNRVAQGYLDCSSTVLHKIAHNSGTELAKMPESRLPRAFYDSRNRFYIAKQNGVKGLLAYAYDQTRLFCSVLLTARDNKARRILLLLKGTAAGLFFSPKIRMPNGSHGK